MLQKILQFILSLFDKTNIETKKLTEKDITNAAVLLSCEEAAIKAVLDVETGNRGGFLLNGDVDPTTKDSPTEYTDFPVILFEGHIFYKELKNRKINPEQYMNKTTANILYKSWTKEYYSSKWGEYNRLNKARKIHEEAALSSASYGLGQIMGFNYKSCGYISIEDFVNDMKISEGKQLLAFCNFIKANSKLLKAIQTKDWKTFARYYNGVDYAKNKYDSKLKEAYNRYKRL